MSLPLSFPLFFLSLALAGPPGSLAAEAEITVTADRIGEDPSDQPPAFTVVTSEQIRSRGASTAAEALKTVVGLAISDLGPEGSQKTVSLRGSTTNEVLLLVDGLRVQDPLSGLADLSALSLLSADRIEVVREGASALYGGEAVGGAVNLITAKGPAPFRVSIENSSYLPAPSVSGAGWAQETRPADLGTLADAQRLRLTWAPRFGDLQVRTGLGLVRASNAYPFLDSSGVRRTLANAGLASGEGLVGLSVPGTGGTWSWNLTGSWASQGVPGPLASPTPQAAQSQASARTSVRYASDPGELASAGLDWSLDGAFRQLRYSASAGSQDTHRIGSLGTDLRRSLRLSDALTLTAGLSASGARAESSALGTPTRFGAGAFLAPSFDSGPLTLRPAVRYDWDSAFFSASPWGGLGITLAGAYRVTENDVVRANASRTYRVPSFEDLYWPQADGAAGNPGLRPETAYAFDMGYRHDEASWTYQTTLYVRWAYDVILWQPGTDGLWRPSNYGSALYPGWEHEGRWRLTPGLQAEAGYAFLYSYLLDGFSVGDDKRVPMTPVHTLKAGLASDPGPLSWSVTAQYSGLRYLKVANAQYLPAWFTVDAFVRQDLGAGLVLILGADNLFGEAYQLAEGYPMPPTRIRLGLEFTS